MNPTVTPGQLWRDTRGGTTSPLYGDTGRTLRILSVEPALFPGPSGKGRVGRNVALRARCAIGATDRETLIRVSRLTREKRFTLVREASGSRIPPEAP